MTITNQNVKIYRGNSATLNVTLETAEGGAYVPAPGDEVKYRLSRNATSPEAEALVSKDLVSGITILASVATIELSSDNTDLEPGIYYHELKIIDPPSDVSTAMVGTVIIKPALNMDPPV
jgi:hypothetical protein